MVRDYIYVKDVTDMIASVCNKQAKHEVYNLGSGSGVTINDLVMNIENATGKKAVTQYQESVPATFVHRVVLNTQRFEDEFGITPETSLQEGLAITYDYIKRKASD